MSPIDVLIEEIEAAEIDQWASLFRLFYKTHGHDFDNELDEIVWTDVVYGEVEKYCNPKTPSIKLSTLEKFYATSLLIGKINADTPNAIVRYVQEISERIAKSLIEAIYIGAIQHFVYYLIFDMNTKLELVEECFGPVGKFLDKTMEEQSLAETLQLAHLMGLNRKDEWYAAVETAMDVDDVLPIHVGNMSSSIITIDQALHAMHYNGTILGYHLIVMDQTRELSEKEVKEILDKKTEGWTDEELQQKAPQVVNILRILERRCI